MPITMYDDIDLSLVPSHAQAVGGYVNGRWATYPEVVRRWPNSEHLSIAVTRHADAECLDVEPGDATNIDAPAWVRRQLARGVKRPAIYTSVSNVAALLKVLAQAGILRSQVRIWTSHWTGRAHLCGPPCGGPTRGFVMPTQADATQWTDRAQNRSLDRSLCRDDFFHAVPQPVPVPKPVPLPTHRIVRGYRIARHLIGGVWYTAIERVFGQAK